MTIEVRGTDLDDHQEFIDDLLRGWQYYRMNTTLDGRELNFDVYSNDRQITLTVNKGATDGPST